MHTDKHKFILFNTLVSILFSHLTISWSLINEIFQKKSFKICHIFGIIKFVCLFFFLSKNDLPSYLNVVIPNIWHNFSYTKLHEIVRCSIVVHTQIPLPAFTKFQTVSNNSNYRISKKNEPCKIIIRHSTLLYFILLLTYFSTLLPNDVAYVFYIYFSLPLCMYSEFI